MCDKRKITVYSNTAAVSTEIKNTLIKKLREEGFTVSTDYDKEAELIICIGGDGTFLEAVHRYNYTETPFIGINTGHLGFFQELSPEDVPEFVANYKKGKYQIQKMTAVKCVIQEENIFHELKALNEIVVKASASFAIHLDISIGGSFIERFSGDGVLVSTPAGSTAYNYSVGGSIVDPRIDLLQLTPIAPMNTTAYRSFTSSILLPSDLYIDIVPQEANRGALIVADGHEYKFDEITDITISFSDTTINLLRFESYDFWNKVKTKFL